LSRARNGVVQGRLIAVPARSLAHLAAYEGAAYRLVRVVVETSSGKTAAHAWIASGGTNHPWKAKGS